MKYLAITAVLCLILAGASFADNVTITEVLTGGNLTLTMPNNFSLSSATLGGSSDKTATSAVNYVVEDSRGTGTGWSLNMSASPFATSGTPQRSMLTANFGIFLMPGAITSVYGQSVDATYGPKATGFPINLASEQKCITTAATYGMGKYSMNIYHALLVYANAYAGTYTATLTATLNNVP